jgi:uncharacterized membrane protein
MTIQQLTPFHQAGLVFGAGFILMLGGIVFDKTGLMAMDPLYPWSIATGFLLLFALLNSLSSLQSDNVLKYWGASIYSYMLLAAASGVAAWQLSGIPIGQAQSYKFIYIVVTFGFLVFLSMVNFMKKIVNFAEREEWNQPRKRR